jgi:hypothetical protein
MAAHYLGGDAAASGYPKALLLRGDTVLPQEQKLAELLSVLGVSWQAVHVGEIAALSARTSAGSAERFCVMTSANSLAAVLGGALNADDALPEWMVKAESVYIYGFREDAVSQCLLRFLSGDPSAKVRLVKGRQVFISVTGNSPAVCGSMSGIHFEARVLERQPVFDLSVRGESHQSILNSNHGQLFVSLKRRGAHLFLNSSANVIDVATPCTKYFDVRENACNTVPIIMYAKWAFGVGETPEIGACLIVDDPLLKPRYGFLRYQEALRLMDEHNFATTIAFIPWNWRRTDARTVQIFHQRPDRLSVCIHGCDHTAKEFAERSTAVLNKRINVANHRMRLFGKRTQLRPDGVMLFPQGAFSEGAARALKLNGFVAAANTEVVPVHEDENKTTVGDLFGQAIMKYASFPMFTRRYLAHGLENFAFDGLLGKPCLIAAHHDDFAGDARILLHVIAKLNSLNWTLRWRSLGGAVSRCFRTHANGDSSRCVEMYGTSLVYKNSQASLDGTIFKKKESDWDHVKAVTVNGLAVDYLRHGEYLRFEAMIPPNESAEVRILYSAGPNLASEEEGINYRAKAVLRRYLSEFRDNYLSRHAHLHQGALRIKEALRL